MIFGNNYMELNERTLQSHFDHAKRWSYGHYILRREIVGVGQWDKFIFSKILLVLELIDDGRVDMAKKGAGRVGRVSLLIYVAAMGVYQHLEIQMV